MTTSARKMVDCRRMPSERNCSLTIAGTEEEVLTVAGQALTPARPRTDAGA